MTGEAITGCRKGLWSPWPWINSYWHGQVHVISSYESVMISKHFSNFCHFCHSVISPCPTVDTRLHPIMWVDIARNQCLALKWLMTVRRLRTYLGYCTVWVEVHCECKKAICPCVKQALTLPKAGIREGETNLRQSVFVLLPYCRCLECRLELVLLLP